MELFLGGRLCKSQLIQPVLTDEGIHTVHVGESRLDCPDLTGNRILIPVQVGLAQPVPQVRQIRLVGIQIL